MPRLKAALATGRALGQGVALWASIALAMSACRDTPGPTSAPREASSAGVTTSPAPTETLGTVAAAALDRILDLERAEDVTCWTSFRQLESFIAGAPLTDAATLQKLVAMRSLVTAVWSRASRSQPGAVLTRQGLKSARVAPEPDRAPDAQDHRTTSEHWRVILAVAQDALRHPGSGLNPLDYGGLEALGQEASWLTLALLREAALAAATDQSDVLAGRHLRVAYQALRDRWKLEIPNYASRAPGPEVLTSLRALTARLAATKLDALRAYNKSELSLQDDLTRLSALPLEPGAVEQLMSRARGMVAFLAKGYEPRRADAFIPAGWIEPSRLEIRPYVTAAQMHADLQELMPHEVHSNGDVTFRVVPNPGSPHPVPTGEREVILRDHEMNAVRDTGVHWKLLSEALEGSSAALDPFAAEMLTEAASIWIAYDLKEAQRLAKEAQVTSIDPTLVGQVHDGRYIWVRAPEDRPDWSDARREEKARLLSTYQAPLFQDGSRTWSMPSYPTPSPHATFEGLPLRLLDVMGGGIAVGDLNGDGWPDLFIGGRRLGRLLMHRGPKGGYEDVTAAWGIPEDLDDARAALFFDRDGDGSQELLVVRSEHPSALYERRESRLVDIASQVGVATGVGAHVASVFDANGDGRLDLYIGYYGSRRCNDGACPGRSLPSLDGRNGSPNQLFVSRPDGTYEERAAALGLDDTGWALAALAYDGRADGALDLYIANDFGPNRHFVREPGQSRFTERGVLDAVADRGSGMNVSIADLGGDSLWDLYITNIDMFAKSIKVIYPSDQTTIDVDGEVMRSFRYLSGNKLYSQSKSGPGFTSEERRWFEPGDRGWAWAALFFELDNDGDQDLYLNNGWISGSPADSQANQLYIQDGGHLFAGPPDEVTNFKANSRSLAVVDVDRDGDEDLIVTQFGEGPRLLLNQVDNGARALRIALEARGPNRDAIGAIVSLRGGPTGLQRRMITCGEGYLGQRRPIAHFGVGDASSLKVTVRWPSGQVSHHALGPGPQVQRVVEPKAH